MKLNTIIFGKVKQTKAKMVKINWMEKDTRQMQIK